jgi:adenine phosphoribosyltransferase
MTELIKENIRTVPDFPVQGIQFRDITSLLENPVAFDDTVLSMLRACSSIQPKTIVAIESRGFIFAGPLAWDNNIPLVLARKPNKLPNDTFEKEYQLEYGSATLEIQKNTSIQGPVIIVDDLIATGGTALACAELITQHWGIEPNDIMILAVVDLPDLGGSKMLSEKGYNVKTLVEFEGE